MIAPGLTAQTLCPLVKSQPQVAINAIASGAIRAYDQGSEAIAAYAGAMGAAIGAANSNGCINEVFEGVNQAIILGGFKVEAVTGKALALGVAEGVASEGGEVLAKATAVVICRGGASASACAKAWNVAIKIDPKNGCAVLVKAYVHARSYCSEGKAYTNVQSTVYKETVGECSAQGLFNGYGSGSNGGVAAGSYGPQGSMSIYQGANGQTVTYADGTTVTQGPGVSSSVWGSNGYNGGSWGWGRRGGLISTLISQGGNGQSMSWGRKMLHAGSKHDSGVLAAVTAGSNLKQLSGVRRLQQWGYFGNNNNYDNNANSFAGATNNGFSAVGVFANSQANARDSGSNSGWGSYWCSWCNSRTTANSAAVATNNGITNGPVVANSVAHANGRH
jgi:hypothetical protein